MRLERDVGNLCPALRVDDRKRALAIPDKHPITRRIDPDIIGVVAQIDAAFARQVFRPQQPHRAIPGIRDIDRVSRRLISDPLRLLQSGHRASHFARRKIDDAETVIPELGDESCCRLRSTARWSMRPLTAPSGILVSSASGPPAVWPAPAIGSMTAAANRSA